MNLASAKLEPGVDFDRTLVSTSAAALVFPELFSPESSAVAGTLLSFGTFRAGFIARPISGIVAGHLGDKHGRKPVIVGALAPMGVATVLVGVGEFRSCSALFRFRS